MSSGWAETVSGLFYGNSMAVTRRQYLIELLEEGWWSLSELQEELQTTVKRLEHDLQHVARSVRGTDRRLTSEPARCDACSFVFTDRAPRRFTTPSRCPRCKNERILPARFHIR